MPFLGLVEQLPLVVTLGDPGGVGPEVAVRAALETRSEPETESPRCETLRRIVFVGSRTVMSETLRLLRLDLRIRTIGSPSEARFEPGAVELIEAGPPSARKSPDAFEKPFEKGRPTPAGGAASYAYIERAVETVMRGEAHALVTAPISKEAFKMAGIPYPGHTEMLAALTSADRYAMMLCGGPLRVVLVTIHTALRDVPRLITRAGVLDTIRLAGEAGRMLGLDAPRIAVAGLNPHAGEAGMFGGEEIEEIAPAVEDARREGFNVTGPYPPDTLFYRAVRGEFDMTVCMYHDQGLIPLKMIAFDTGVNVTVGLPIVRTSPDHGTAYDIAWKGVANPSSMREAMNMARRLKPAKT
jgi:4-hydroxythreonine-4-phosphate dehydrogenase